VIAGAMGEIMINKRDVKQGKVLILYNTIKKKLVAITYTTVYLFKAVPIMQ